MKRKPEVKASARFGDILQATSIDQRAWIGAVALAYNETEEALHKLTGSCLMSGAPSMAITSRINGTDGLIAIIQESVDGIGLSSRPLFDKTLVEHGFSYLKKLRDAVIHATILDTTTALATAPGKRGKKPEEVLLAPKALEGLYRRLVFVTWELQSLERIMSSECAIRLSHAFGVTDGQRKQHNEQDIQDATARCLRNQSQRLSLPPFPKFPDPPDVREVLRKWHEDYHANLWFQVEG